MHGFVDPLQDVGNLFQRYVEDRNVQGERSVIEQLPKGEMIPRVVDEQAVIRRIEAALKGLEVGAECFAILPL